MLEATAAARIPRKYWIDHFEWVVTSAASWTIVGDSRDEDIAADPDIANGSSINHAQLNFSFPYYRRHSFGKIVSGTPYLTIGSIAGADFVAPIIGVDFFEGRIGCYISSSLRGSKLHAPNKISYRLYMICYTNEEHWLPFHLCSNYCSANAADSVD